MIRPTFVDSFCAVEELCGKNLTYEQLKAAVLRAGRFSVFEATETAKHARLYTQLCEDLEVETDNSVGYPWTLIRKRVVPLCSVCKGLKRVERLHHIAGRNYKVYYDPCPKCSLTVSGPPKEQA